MPDPTLDFPPKPDPMDFGDCCGGGCAQCALDSYYEALKLWQQRVAEIQQLAGDQRSAQS
jgi:hypothetical protein